MIARTEEISRSPKKDIPIAEDDAGVTQWFALPEFVRRAYSARGLHMQLTTGCTCACWYCLVVDVSQKGEIYSMIPLGSVKKVIESAGSSGYSHGWDSYYRASDPFDYPQYLAVMEVAIAQRRRVYTSTTVPRGADDDIRQVIEAIAKLDDHKKSLYPLRFSVNRSHRFRAELLIQYAKKLGITVERGDRTDKTKLAVYPVLKNGEVSELSLAGITRRQSDGLVITPDGVITSISMPVCQASPTGILTIQRQLDGKVFPETHYSDDNLKGWYFTGPFAYMDGSEHISSLPPIGLDGDEAVLRFINGARRLQDLLLTYNFNFGFTNDESKLLAFQRTRLEGDTEFNHDGFIDFAQDFLALPEELMSDSVLRAFLEPLLNVIRDVAGLHAITIPKPTKTIS